MPAKGTTGEPASRGVLWFACSFPLLLTWVYFDLLAGGDAKLQQIAYGLGKCIQFGLPLFWLLLVLRRPLRLSGLRPGRATRGLWVGGGFGLLAGGVIYLVYRGWLLPSGALDGPVEAMRVKVVGIGIDSAGKFAWMGVAYSLVHSLLEEYYWRWFVFGELRRRLSLFAAVLLSSVGFTAHHVLVLATYFGWDSPLTYLSSAGVGGAGAVWALLYQRSGSLYGAWLSHCLVDAAIFLVGYELMLPYLG